MVRALGVLALAGWLLAGSGTEAGGACGGEAPSYQGRAGFRG